MAMNPLSGFFRSNPLQSGGISQNENSSGQPNGDNADQNGDNGQQNQNGNQNQNGGQQQNGNQQQKKQDDSLFGGLFGTEEDQSDFEIPDDFLKTVSGNNGSEDGNGDGTGNDEDDPDVKLKENMESAFKNAGMKLEQLPKDIDFSTAEGQQKFANAIIGHALNQAIHIMSMPVGRLADSLRDEMQTSSTTHAKRAQIQIELKQAFQPFAQAFAGDKTQERLNVAKEMFQRAYKVNKGDMKKAADSAKKAVEALFDIKIYGQNAQRQGYGVNGGNGNGPNGGAFLEGDKALDNLFDGIQF